MLLWNRRLKIHLTYQEANQGSMLVASIIKIWKCGPHQPRPNLEAICKLCNNKIQRIICKINMHLQFANILTGNSGILLQGKDTK